MNTWLALDATYLCHRAYHAMGHLKFGDIPTGVTFGFLRDIQALQELFETKLIAFCWDVGQSKRKEIYSGYKEGRRKRHEQDDEFEREAYLSFRRQMERLRTDYLKRLGYRNLYWQSGYEADDLIAEFRDTINRNSKMVIVSADQDLFQLLGPNTEMWNPHRQELTTAERFEDEWGIEPAQWPDVKAIAGCSSDDIPGVQRVGEKTAVKYLAGRLKPESKAFERITAGNDLWRRNLKLVTLPFPGVKPLKLKRDGVTDEKYAEVCDELGIRRL